MHVSVDDIDHLGNRRIRTVGEQLGQQFNVGMASMARTIKERMNMRDTENFTPQDLGKCKNNQQCYQCFLRNKSAFTIYGSNKSIS